MAVRTEQKTCPKCGENATMSKYWRTHVGPYGYEGNERITRVIMGRFHCPNSHSFNACIWKEEVSA